MYAIRSYYEKPDTSVALFADLFECNDFNIGKNEAQTDAQTDIGKEKCPKV